MAGYQIQQRNADFIILEDTLSAEEYGVGFKKGNTELRDQVQATLEEMAADGTLTEISKKWFGEDVTTIGKDGGEAAEAEAAETEAADAETEAAEAEAETAADAETEAEAGSEAAEETEAAAAEE